jgi:hypothetical protein
MREKKDLLYKAFDVWQREGNRLRVYRCFEILPDGGFAVQSCDFVQPDQSPASFSQRNYFELLHEQAPDARSGAFATIEEAIAAHNRYFDQ